MVLVHVFRSATFSIRDSHSRMAASGVSIALLLHDCFSSSMFESDFELLLCMEKLSDVDCCSHCV